MEVPHVAVDCSVGDEAAVAVVQDLIAREYPPRMRGQGAQPAELRGERRDGHQRGSTLVQFAPTDFLIMFLDANESKSCESATT